MAADLAKSYARKGYHGIRRAARHIKSVLTDKNPKLLIFTYHRVLPEFAENPLHNIVKLRTFERQIDFISRRFRVVSLGEGLKDPGRRGARDSAVFTFDDGYTDNYEIVFPLLKKKGIPAAFFVSAGYIGTGGPQWDWEVIMRIVRNPAVREVNIGTSSIVAKEREPRLAFAYRVIDRLKSSGLGELKNTIDYLRSIPGPGVDLSRDRCLGWDHLKKMSGEGMEIGSHGITHRSLARIPAGDAGREITESRRIISERTGRDCRDFAFPFGSARDYNDVLIGLVRKEGYRSCILNVHGYNRLSADPFSLKRIIMDEDTPSRFIFG